MKSTMRMMLAAAAMIFAGSVGAQNFPNHAVTLTVGFAPGGGADTAARFIAQRLSESIGQPVVVENKVGAGGNIAAQHIAAAPPDGYIIHLTSVGPMTGAPHIVASLPYDPKRDIAPITIGVVFPNVFVVYSGVPAKTLAEFVLAGKARALATTGAKRTSTMPDVPTVAESGYPGFEATNWYAFVAPGKMPRTADTRRCIG